MGFLVKTFSHIGRKPSGSPLEVALYVSRRRFLKKSFLEKKLPSTVILSFDGMFADCWQIFFDMLLTNFLYDFQSSMLEAKNVWKKEGFHVFFPNFAREKFLPRTELLRQHPQNCFLGTQRKTLVDCFCQHSEFFCSVRPLGEKMSYFERKILSLFSRLHYTREEVFLIVFIRFLWTLKMSDFEQIIFGMTGKASFYQSRYLLEGKKFFLKKTFFVSFLCTLGQSFSHIGLDRFGSLLEFALYMTERKDGKNFFRGKTSFNF